MPQSAAKISLIRGLEYHLEDCLARGLSPRTVEGKHYVLKGFVAWCLTQGVTLADDVTLLMLEEYRKHLFHYRQPHSKKPLDIATQRKRLTDVAMYFRRLRKTGLVTTDPSVDFDLPLVPRRLPQGYLKIPEIEAVCDMTLLYGIKGYRDRAIVEVHYATGIRRAECAALDILDIDFEDEMVTVRRGKGQRDRRVPIAQRSLAWIRFYLDQIRPKLARMDSGNALFLNDRGQRFRPQLLGDKVARYVRLAGIDKRGGTTLMRHSVATHMIEAGAELPYVQDVMGHADISTTQIYIHVSKQKTKEVYRRTHPANFPRGSSAPSPD